MSKEPKSLPLILRSRPLSIDALLSEIRHVGDLLARNETNFRETIRFTRIEDMQDVTDAFTGTLCRPISLENFDSESDYLVGVVRHSEHFDTPDEAAQELSQILSETLRWQHAGLGMQSRVIPDGRPGAPFLGIDYSERTGGWEIDTARYNEAIQQGRVSAFQQKETFDILVSSLGSPFGQSASCLEIVDGYLKYVPGRNSRMLSDGGLIGIGDVRLEMRLLMHVTDDETPLLIDGLTNFARNFHFAGRVKHRMSALLKHYEAWQKAFDHRDGAYEYHYESILADPVIDFLEGRSTTQPRGMVPYAKYETKDSDDINLCFEFRDDGVIIWLSGSDELGIEQANRFLKQTGLDHYFDESSVVFQ